jgi:hypothetical protein
VWVTDVNFSIQMNERKKGKGKEKDCM